MFMGYYFGSSLAKPLSAANDPRGAGRMAVETIRNPVEWSADQVRKAAQHAASTGRTLRGEEAGRMAIRKIENADLWAALRQGVEDFKACRTDVLFTCLLYPAIGLVLARSAFQYDMLPLLFPLASGFALVGPIAAIGLYDMSRRRERGEEAVWSTALGLLRSPSFAAILVLALALLFIFGLWLVAAQLIYNATLGPQPPVAVGAFVGDVLTTGAGWAMAFWGMLVGFLFACAVLAISVVSFPLLVDRDVGVVRAVGASIKATARNLGPVLLWGAIVAGALALGSVPLFLGLIVVMPVLGHATWHLYRKLVVHE